jgi:hypothetical protein
MLCSITISSFNEAFCLALIQWYDYKNKNNLNLHNCPWIKLTSQYEFIPVGSAVESVHIVPRFEKNNEYLVNTFIF